MNNVWLQILITMFGGSILKSAILNSLAWVMIDLLVLGISYLILRRHPMVNLKSSMLFLGGLTLISILTDLRLMSEMVGNILVLAVLAWMMLGRRGQSNGGKSGQSKITNIRHKWHK